MPDPGAMERDEMSMGKLYPKDASRNKGQFEAHEGICAPPNRLELGWAHEVYGEAWGLSGPRITRTTRMPKDRRGCGCWGGSQLGIGVEVNHCPKSQSP